MGQSLILWDACSKRDLRAGKHEGISHKTKTLRRSSYGLPDDEYFFLKLIDSSHKGIKLRRHTEFRTDPKVFKENSLNFPAYCTTAFLGSSWLLVGSSTPHGSLQPLS